MAVLRVLKPIPAGFLAYGPDRISRVYLCEYQECDEIFTSTAGNTKYCEKHRIMVKKQQRKDSVRRARERAKAAKLSGK